MNKVENTLSARPSKGLLIFAYLMLYLVWGSTYLAIKFSIETIPPLLSGAIRFLTAGALLLAVRMLQTGYRTTSCGWKHAFVAGLLVVGALVLTRIPMAHRDHQRSGHVPEPHRQH